MEALWTLIAIQPKANGSLGTDRTNWTLRAWTTGDVETFRPFVAVQNNTHWTLRTLDALNALRPLRANDSKALITLLTVEAEAYRALWAYGTNGTGGTNWTG